MSNAKQEFEKIRDAVEAADKALADALAARAKAVTELAALRARAADAYFTLPRDVDVLTRAVERVAESALAVKYPDRPLRANVEFYTSVLLDAVGLPRALFSPTFAVARAAGWCAHIAEQRAIGKLIRPASTYIGARASSI